MGVLYDRNEKFDTAKSTFEQLVQTFPAFDLIPEAQLRLGGVWGAHHRYDDGGWGCAILSRFDLTSPKFLELPHLDGYPRGAVMAAVSLARTFWGLALRCSDDLSSRNVRVGR